MKRYLTWTIIIAVAAILLPQMSFGQSVKRQSIGSYGTNSFTNSAIIGQTIGQPYATNTYSGSVVSLTPGFQQPITYSKAKTTQDFLIVNLRAFPNPASANFTLKSQELLENVALTITDINGRLLLGKQLPELTTLTINCSVWQAGMYFITVESPNMQFRYSTKIIITNH